jgi:UDP-2,3-diacylglucosamine hydrolase
MTAAALPLHRRDAPPAWRAIELLSDVHLCEQAPRTFTAWRQQLLGSDADAIVMLGDLFEVWVGDDARDGAFERACIEVLREASRRCTLAFMPGNRDFLVGPALLREAGVEAWDDATVLHAFGRPLLLTHGDALCLDDVDYQRFRAQVRSVAWQQEFLRRPLPERQRLARAMRDASTAHQAQRSPALWADVDPAAALQLLDAAGSDTLIHGHTHRPGRATLSATATRYVLSDWDFDRSDADSPRGDVLRVDAGGVTRHAALAGAGAARP